MTVRRKRSTGSLTIKTAELAFAVPQVVAHRLTRLAHAGPTLSPRDRTEFTRMVAEKHSAFAESWKAMALQALRSNQAFAATLARVAWTAPSLRGAAPPRALAAAAQRGAVAVLDGGLAPVHRRAVANAKRLARTRLR